MKVKLLKRLRQKARSEVTIYSITRTDGITTGMSYGHSSSCYRGLFSFGDTEEDIMQKVFRIYMANNIQSIRERYKKYSARFLKSKP